MKLLLAISGGIDSAVLLDVFAKQRFEKLGINPPLSASGGSPPPFEKGGLGGISIHLAYFNHGTAHGEEAEKMVQQLAEKYQLPLKIGRAKKKLASEAAFREARYDFLIDFLVKSRADAIVTAHHADDQIETVLLNLTRGSGLAGLAGMQEASTLRGATILRPLLDVPKKEIESYAKKNRLVWINDPSNSDETFARNRLRKHVVPELEKINPKARTAILRTAAQIREADDFLQKSAASWLGKKTALPLAQFTKLAPTLQKNIVRLIHEREIGHTQKLEETHFHEIMKLAENPAGNKKKQFGALTFRTGKVAGQRVLLWTKTAKISAREK